jgi:hypothetical protein
MKCDEVREILPAYSRDGDVGLPVRRHLSRCPDCTSELANYEAMFGSLASLKTHTIEPPPELFHQLAAIPYRSNRIEDARTHVVRNRNKYATGVAVATAGAVAAALWRARRTATA